MSKKLIYPKQAQLFISEVCSEGCHYCPYSQMTDEEKKKLLKNELSTEQWQKAVTFFRQKLGIKLFVLIGGEPTAKKGLEKLISFMSRNLKDTTVVLSTSGIALLKNSELLEKLVQAGLKNVVVSMDGLNKIVLQRKIDLDSLLNKLSKDSIRKSALGYYLFLEMRKRFPKKKFNFSVNCIVNRKTIPQIVPLYKFLSEQKIFLNLCPEQTICFDENKTARITKKENQELIKLTDKLIEVKKQKNNFLIPSLNFLESLPSFGINQAYRCSFSLFPSTIHLTSSGAMPFCIWKKGDLREKFNIMELVKGKKNYEDWLNLWQSDKEGQKCSCSWSFIDRVGGFGVSGDKEENNFWDKFIRDYSWYK